jgi:hypothetical protein
MRATVHVEENKERPTFEVGTAYVLISRIRPEANTRV